MTKPPDLSNYVAARDYDRHVTQLYREMELEMIASLKRNLAGHKGEELKVGMDYTAWQAEKLRQLTHYRVQNRRMVTGYTNDIYRRLGPTLLEEFQQGIIGEQSRYNAAVAAGHPDALQGTFFAIDDRKVNALIAELHGSIRAANSSALRKINDAYRQVIFDTTLFASNGVLTEKQAFDRAIQKFTERGIDSIVYSNGARVNIANYAGMAIRTANLRANLMGSGEFRQQLGEHLIQITKHGTACPLCIPWETKILIDDVYSGGTRADGNYPLLSDAMEQGLYHPNCRHGNGTYYPELDEVYDDVFGENGHAKADVAHAENQVQKFKRLSAGSTDPKMKAKYDARLQEWEGILQDAKNRLHSLSDSGIISKPPANAGAPISTGTGKHDVHFVGKIDLDRFREVFPDLLTDEVIITDERIEHIEKRHPGTYRKYSQHIPEILDGFQYMLEDDLPNTALLLKQLENDDGARVGLVLRLQTSKDVPGFKNSVISMWKVDADRWRTYTRSKKIVDKRA